jgi:hypothetical protein
MSGGRTGKSMEVDVTISSETTVPLDVLLQQLAKLLR